MDGFPEEIVSGETTYRLTEADGKWMYKAQGFDDPDFTFLVKAESATKKIYYVNLASRAKTFELPDISQLQEPEELDEAIDIGDTCYKLRTVPDVEEKVYAPNNLTHPSLSHCWLPKLDRLHARYFFVNIQTKRKVWILPEVFSFKDRIEAMYKRYCPERLGNLEEDAARNASSPGEFISDLVQHFGPEPSAIRRESIERLSAIFSKYDPPRLNEIDALLSANEGHEKELISSLVQEYGGVEPPTYRQRITAIYEKYNPEKVNTVEDGLRMHAGKELQLIAALVKKYGSEPLAGGTTTTVKTPEELAIFRNRVEAMYTQYCPSKLSTVEQGMKMYEGQEELLMEALVKKYGPEPIAPLSDTTVEHTGNTPMFTPRDAVEPPSSDSASSGIPRDTQPEKANETGNEPMIHQSNESDPVPGNHLVRTAPEGTLPSCISPESTELPSTAAENLVHEPISHDAINSLQDNLAPKSQVPVESSVTSQTVVDSVSLGAITSPEPSATDGAHLALQEQPHVSLAQTNHEASYPVPELSNQPISRLTCHEPLNESLPVAQEPVAPETNEPNQVATEDQNTPIAEVPQEAPTEAEPSPDAGSHQPAQELPREEISSSSDKAPLPAKEDQMTPAQTLEVQISQVDDSVVVANTADSPHQQDPPTESTHRDRLVRFYQKHNPKKLQTVDSTLEQYAGREDSLFIALVSKYGPEPEVVPPEFQGKSNAVENEDFKARVHRIYGHYRPKTSKEKVARTLAMYEGQEELLIEELVQKFGPEPGTPEFESSGMDSQSVHDLPAYSIDTPSDQIPRSFLSKYAKVAHEYDRSTFGTAMLRKMMEVPNPPIRELIETNVLPTIVDYSRTDEDPKLQHEASSLLCLVAFADVEHGDLGLSNVPKFTVRKRITAMIEQYCPEKMNSLPHKLERFAGQEKVLLEALVRKYGSEPPVASMPTHIVKERLENVVVQHAPQVLSKIPKALSKFSGLEEVLLDSCLRCFVQLTSTEPAVPDSKHAEEPKDVSQKASIEMADIAPETKPSLSEQPEADQDNQSKGEHSADAEGLVTAEIRCQTKQATPLAEGTKSVNVCHPLALPNEPHQSENSMEEHTTMKKVSDSQEVRHAPPERAFESEVINFNDERAKQIVQSESRRVKDLESEPQSQPGKGLGSEPQPGKDVVSEPQPQPGKGLVSEPQPGKGLVSEPQSQPGKDLVSEPQSQPGKDLVSDPQKPSEENPIPLPKTEKREASTQNDELFSPLEAVSKIFHHQSSETQPRSIQETSIQTVDIGIYPAAALQQLKLQQDYDHQAQIMASLSMFEKRITEAYEKLALSNERNDSLRGENHRLTKLLEETRGVAEDRLREMRNHMEVVHSETQKVIQECELAKATFQSQQILGTAAAKREAEVEKLKSEEMRLSHTKDLMAMQQELNKIEQQKMETQLHTQHLQRRLVGYEKEAVEAQSVIEELKGKLLFKPSTANASVSTEDSELPAESLSSTPRGQHQQSPFQQAQTKLTQVSAELEQWMTIARRLEVELRTAERQREEFLSAPCSECETATRVIFALRTKNQKLEARCEQLELEALAAPAPVPLASSSLEAEVRLARLDTLRLQQELASAQATNRQQKAEIQDLRGLLAIHMASPGRKKNP